MTKKAFDKIAAGLEDAIAYMEGDKTRGAEHKVFIPTIDIAALRKRLGMSQDRFAATYGFSAATIRNWEQGRRHPEGPARILLKVIDKEPEAVKRALEVA